MKTDEFNQRLKELGTWRTINSKWGDAYQEFHLAARPCGDCGRMVNNRTISISPRPLAGVGGGPDHWHKKCTLCKKVTTTQFRKTK